jgi:hypothetical protein
MALIQGPAGLKQDEMNQIQDPSMPSPLGLDMNNPQVQAALASMNISGFNPTSQTQAAPAAPTAPSLSDQQQAAIAKLEQDSSPAPSLSDQQKEAIDKLAATPDDKSDDSKDLDFSEKPGQKSYADQLKAAQKNKIYNNALDRMVEASKQMGSAIAGGNMAVFKPDISQEEASIKASDQPIKDLMARKAAEGTDPNSGYSKGLRDWAKQAYGIDLKGASAEQVEKIAPYLSKQYEAQENRKARSEDLKYKYDSLKAMKEAAVGQAAQGRQDKANEKASADQLKAQEHTTSLLEQMRGSPAVAQAEKDIYASQKVDSLINSMGGDPNKLNQQQVKLLTNEVAKIAAGGVSSQHELDSLTPSTLTGSLAGVYQKLMNEPTPANAGAFLKQYQNYAKDITKDAQKTIKDRYGRIINSRSDQLGDKNTKKLTDLYINRFDNEESSPKFDKDVLDYAKEHNITPDQANQIKQQRTGGK